ncbi:MAG: ATP--cob(I)alamin adenosyltransferase [Phycisphaerae bacterium]|jgi:cob(I)alamin adenosyltransferase|nr:MAG: ATP--cob(I)alamin adenosyltransferase [Phycisphaerae bacterium]
MKIYTRTGDDGTTGLIGGDRVRKSDPRLECYGTVDELNASIGLVQVIAPTWLVEWLTPIQNELFVIGSFLAAPENDPTAQKYLPALDENMIGRLEMQIDQVETELPRLKYFVLPGGTELSARLHLARTVCRRAERLVVAFSMDRPINPVILTYLNRLSDWLFVMSRLSNHRSGVPDVPWIPQRSGQG